MAANLNKDEAKQALKEAIKEWIDDQYKTFGKWAIRSIAAWAFGYVAYLFLTHGGLEQIKPH